MRYTCVVKRGHLLTVGLVSSLLCAPVSAELVFVGLGNDTGVNTYRFSIEAASVHRVGPNVRYLLETERMNSDGGVVNTTQTFVEVDCVGRRRLESRGNYPAEGDVGYAVIDGTRPSVELKAACELAETLPAQSVATAAVSAPVPESGAPSPEVDPSEECFAALESDVRVKPLALKIGAVSLSRPRDVSFDMMVSKAFPTKVEKGGLRIWGTAQQACVDMGRGFRQHKTHPAYVAAYEAFQSNGLKLIAGLYGGALNYGQFIAERDSLVSDMRQKVAAIIQDIQNRALAQAVEQARAHENAQAQAQATANAQAQARAQSDALTQHQAQAVARQRALEAELSQARTNAAIQMLLQARPKPMPMMRSPTVNCTSRAVGNTVQTDCN